MSVKNKKNIHIVLIGALLFLSIYLIIENNNLKRNTRVVIDREQNTETFFTNPMLDFELSKKYSETVIPAGSVRNLVESLKNKTGVEHISVYFRDLNNGPWVGVDEKEYFSPASMLKTPILIALYKWSETDSSVLEKKKVAESRFFLDIPLQTASEVASIAVGKSYSLYDLAVKMIRDSDNIATAMLYEAIPKTFVDNTFSHIGVTRISDGGDILLRVKDAASFYRILFNATYLNRENSETVLKILSSTSFTEGLVAGTPEGVVVAHKFGERFPATFLDTKGISNQQVVQLHDCGIIYFPQKPYILCVMTRGNNIEKQKTIIAELSRFFYEYTSKQ